VRKLVVVVAVLGTFVLAPAAQAAVDEVFGGDATCAVRADGIRVCQGVTETFDGTTPIDVNVILPPAGQGDGPFPTIGWFHGWGGSKQGVGADGNAQGRARDWALRGYAVFSMSDRGWGRSCGGQDPKRLTPACANGYNHLMDTRFEVRDAQYLLGRLADENVVVPNRIGVTGGSYGGGISMALAALRNRVMHGALAGESEDALVPWTSPAGKPMQIAVAIPEIPWTDLAYSLMPNGRTLDYVADAPYLGPDGNAPIGVLKQSFVAGLYAVGLATSNYPPPGADPDADLTRWFAMVNAGEPYDENPLAADLVDEITTHHSSYYIPTATGYGAEGNTAPAPLLISNGWTDDLFPPDEAIRFYNRTRSEFPGADIALYFLDYGHMRGQNKAEDVAKLHAAEEAWLDHYLKGIGPEPRQGATAITQTCDEPSAGPFRASTWDRLSPGEVRLVDESSKTIAPAGGSPQDGQAFDPVAGGGDPCAQTPGSDKPGTATYRMRPARGGGFTLAGSPTVIADIGSPGPHDQIAARLLDVAPDGQQTLVARGLYRPDPDGRQVFQLHANGWKFENGHVAKLELLPNDSPYGRVTNGQAPVTVANLDLRLPVLERPGAAGGAVREPLPAFIPEGYRPARGIEAAGSCETGLAERGTRDRDRIKGTEGGDRLRGGRGKDRIAAKGGDDCVAGNRGKDKLVGDEGKDKLRGGKGNDRIKAKDGERDRVSCGSGEGDRVIADGKDKLRGCERKRRR
jgi:predicted acyl esterase